MSCHGIFKKEIATCHASLSRCKVNLEKKIRCATSSQCSFLFPFVSYDVKITEYFTILEAIAAFPEAYFGPGRGRIWLDDVHCLGHESDIEHCDHHGWGSNNCRHSEDAAVKCRPINTPTPGKYFIYIL